MAQILESQGTMVTVSLIEGDPEILTGWSESFLSNDNFVNKLTTLYNSFSKEVILNYYKLYYFICREFNVTRLNI